jgi:hypothetical protein
MRQLTIRGFGKELERRIRRLARREGISLNKAVMRLLRQGAGLDGQVGPGARVGTALDHAIGTWTDAEADDFAEAVKDLERVETAFWK